MIKIEKLDKYFNKGKSNENHVLKEVSLELGDRGLVCILGESGSGKKKNFQLDIWKKKMEENQEQSIMGFGMREVNSFLWLILMIFYYRMRYQK